MKTLLRGTAAALGLLALAGCVRVESHQTINEDETVSGSLLVAVNEMLLELAAAEQGSGGLNVDLGELLDSADIDEEYTDVTTDGVDIAVEEVDEGGYVGVRITLSDVPIEAINAVNDSYGMGGGASLAREGDYFVYSIPGDALRNEDIAAAVRDPQFQAIVDATTIIEFPGDVVEASMGKVDGNTVTLTAVDLFSGKDLYIKAGAIAPFDWQRLVTIVGVVLASLGALALLAGIYVVWVRPRMHKRRVIAAALAELEQSRAAAAEATLAEATAPKRAPAKKPAPKAKPAAKATPASKPAAPRRRPPKNPGA